LDFQGHWVDYTRFSIVTFRNHSYNTGTQENMRLRKFAQVFIRFLFHLFSRVEATGLENIPKTGGCILSPNHVGFLDSSLVFILVDRDDTTGLVAKKYQKNPIFRQLVKIVDGIWLNREEADTHAIRAACDYLQKGGILGVAPEGTRSRTGALIPAKTGVAYLADRAGVPIIPVAITGTETVLNEWKRLRLPHITAKFGKPFNLSPLDHNDRNGSLRRNTDEIMCRIAAMLPPAYRGAYADHPRLKELLQAGID
jgi:1-acyl-sn-glycerol-3-phosphate acyltransferase